MTERQPKKSLFINLNERNLSVICHSLFSSWMLAFLFEGQIFYSIAGAYNYNPDFIMLCSVAAIFAGLLLCGLFIKTKKAVKQLFLYSYLFFIAVSVIFFFPPSVFWMVGILASSFLAGGCVAAWAFFLKSGTPKNERIKTVADMLILSNVLMILLNMAAIHMSPDAGLALSILMLLSAFVFALKLPEDHETVHTETPVNKEGTISIAKLLVFFCIFIALITIDSGLMYQVVNPAFTHLEWLTSWYWAIPYIAALVIIRNLPARTNHTYILYIAIAMIGLSFIGFMSLGRGVVSYILINTLMMGAFGVYDLFWWSILGEMLEFHKNPSVILGMGMSANVFGILLGGLISSAITSSDKNSSNPMLLALVVVFVTLVLLPPLNKHLSSLLKGHVYLTEFSGMSAQEQTKQISYTARFGNLSERESQVASLLLQAKTYRAIAGELHISENTVKYYVKNIYSKFEIQSRLELINIMLKKETKTKPE